MRPKMNLGVIDVTTTIVLRTAAIVWKYDLPDTTNCSSTVYISFENLFIILPIGVVSKKAIGA